MSQPFGAPTSNAFGQQQQPFGQQQQSLNTGAFGSNQQPTNLISQIGGGGSDTNLNTTQNNLAMNVTNPNLQMSNLNTQNANQVNNILNSGSSNQNLNLLNQAGNFQNLSSNLSSSQQNNNNQIQTIQNPNQGPGQNLNDQNEKNKDTANNKSDTYSGSSFQVLITGTLESCCMGASTSRGPLMCVFSLSSGCDWSVLSGNSQGITQLSCPSHSSSAGGFFGGNSISSGGGGKDVVWNFPISCAFKSTNMYGWPRILLSVYGTDLCNRRVCVGYGSVHVPCSPGRHSRTVRLYKPISSSWLVRFLGWLLGNPAQLVDPRIISGSEGREVVRVQSGGKISVTFNVLVKGHKEFHYEMGVAGG